MKTGKSITNMSNRLSEKLWVNVFTMEKEET